MGIRGFVLFRSLAFPRVNFFLSLPVTRQFSDPRHGQKEKVQNVKKKFALDVKGG